ncbi:MAG TPA: hypothetical protein VGN23_02080 [Verrucomicrobiae bacterium]|jgi:hypothetical protein
MNKIRLFLFVTLAMMCFTHRACAQATYSPLFLFTNGDGGVTPYQSGDSLEVGQNYEMTAIPNPGYMFSCWEPVNVFVITQTNYNSNGPILPPVVSIVPSVVDIPYTNDVTLDFTNQAEMLITSSGSNPSIIRASGWQANFIPLSLQAVAANNVFQLSISLPSPYPTIVQSSPDLINWTNICTNIPPFTFTDSIANGMCFYRGEVDTNN